MYFIGLQRIYRHSATIYNLFNALVISDTVKNQCVCELSEEALGYRFPSKIKISVNP